MGAACGCVSKKASNTSNNGANVITNRHGVMVGGGAQANTSS